MSIQKTQLFPPPVRGSSLDLPLQRYLATLQMLLPLNEVNTAAGNVVIALPAPGLNSDTGESAQNQELIYIKTTADAHTVTITGAITGTVTLKNQFDSARFKSDATSWLGCGVAGSGFTSALTLETNGILNGLQTLQNLKSGAGITLADDGVGGITIANSSPGTSVSAAWMLSAGIFCLPLNTGGSSNFIDLAFRVAVCRFQIPFALPGFAHLDGTMRTALGGGSNIGYAIYDDSKNLVWQSGAFNLTNSATQKLVSFATPALTIAAGTYYLAWSSDTVNVSTWGVDLTPMVFLSGSSDANILNQGPTTFGYAANPATNAAGLTFPATLGALTSYAGGVNNFVLPYVFFRP